MASLLGLSLYLVRVYSSDFSWEISLLLFSKFLSHHEQQINRNLEHSNQQNEIYIVVEEHPIHTGESDAKFASQNTVTGK